MNPLQSIALKGWMAVMESPSSTVADNLRATALYTAAAGGLLLVTAFRNVLQPFLSVAASRRLHNGMARAVLRAKISWFEATPVGRILNRFSSDISAIDQQVMEQFKSALMQLFNVIGIALVCCLGSAELTSQLVVLAAVLLCVLLSWAIYQTYRVAAREQKRLESVTKSPLFAFFGEMVSGAAVIRAFGAERRTIALADRRVDDANRALFYLWHTNQWLRVSMNMVGSLVTGSVVATVLWQAQSLGGGAAGLCLSYATQFTNAIQFLFRVYTQLEVSMNDVERVDEYTMGLEAELYKDGDRGGAGGGGGGEEGGVEARAAPPDWPSQGQIEFKDVRMQYKSAARPVFQSLSFVIPPRTRVGVVGRTGAGKSSLTVALFRVVELSGGAISIDGVDVGALPLRRLRRAMSIIMQEPTLFRGTLRYNLSPVDDVEESALWEALARAGLDAKVRERGGLDADVAEAGGNLSAGERQLVCMARALLVKRPVLVMDEATASVDHATDARIQEMVRSEFNGTCTVLTIAHRLNTVAFYDRVLVMGKGEVVEYDAPAALLRKQDGVFRAMGEETGDLAGLLAMAGADAEEG